MIETCGIYDYDFCARVMGLPAPSLEAMKMATYLKKQKKICRLLSSMEQIANYDIVYFFSNLPLDELPTELLLMTNVEFYGYYFPNKIPKLAQHLLPDITIYKDTIQSKIVDKKVNTSKALSFLESSYCQIIADGERLPLPVIYPRKKIFIYDKDFLGYDDCWEILDKIIEKHPSSIYMTNHIQCHTIGQFLKLREDYEKVSRANRIILDYYVPLHQLEVYFGKYKMKLLGEITKNSSVGIYLGKNYGNNVYSNIFYIRNLLYCLNLLFSYYSRNIPVVSEIYYPQGETDNPYLEIYKGIRAWANDNKNWDLKLEDTFKMKKRKEPLEQLLEKHPIMKPFFTYSKNDLKNTRGIWRII